MSRQANSRTVILTHPVTGTEKKVDAILYAAVKEAIIKSLQKSSGKTFTQLTDDVVKTVNQKMPLFKGSIPWYTISIRLDLETRGIVETFTDKGKKLNRLKKKAA